MLRKTTEVTIETERVISIVQCFHAVEAWCEDCGGPTLMIGMTQAAEALGCSERTVSKEIKADRLHYNATSAGQIFVCLASLLKQLVPHRDK